jgi:hypothetical protein
LLRVQTGEVDEELAEPEVPAGLARLTGGETALVEFLRIDPDLIAAAAQRSSGAGAQARTAGQLLSIAKARRQEAEERAAQKAQREQKKREAAEASIRAKYLQGIAAREADARREVGTLVESRKPTAYDQAVLLLRDLRDICDTTERALKFRAFVEDLRERHAAKASFLKRLDRVEL